MSLSLRMHGHWEWRPSWVSVSTPGLTMETPLSLNRENMHSRKAGRDSGSCLWRWKKTESMNDSGHQTSEETKRDYHRASRNHCRFPYVLILAQWNYSLIPKLYCYRQYRFVLFKSINIFSEGHKIKWTKNVIRFGIQWWEPEGADFLL